MESKSKWKCTIGMGAILCCLWITMSTCDHRNSVGVRESLSVVPDLTLIEGAENTTITINRSSASYFSLDLSNIAPNKYIAEGEKTRGWCIAWKDPISSNNTRHEGLKLYSTFGDERWQPVNYLLNIRPYLQMNDPDLTYREIQVAIWSLLDFPEFDLNRLSPDQLPSDMVSNGGYNFDRQKADRIVSHVEQNYESFRYSSASTFAVIAETAADTQTLIIEVDETVWAYGRHSFRGRELRDQLGITGTGKGQWGWIFEMDTDYETTELIAGGGNDDGTKAADEAGTVIGSLDMEKSGNLLEVTYSAFSGYLINDLHLWAGCSLEDFPWVGNTGNVTPGGFPYHFFDGDPTDSHTFSVGLSSYQCSGNIFIAANAGELFIIEELELPTDTAVELVFELTDLSQYELTRPIDINDNGNIIGSNYYWDTTTNVLFEIDLRVHSLNNHNQVIGYKRTDFGFMRAYIWQKGMELSPIGTLYDETAGPEMIRAFDMNNQGQVVGEVEIGFMFEDSFIGEDVLAFMWDPIDGMRIISFSSLAWANSINDKSQVIGEDASLDNFAFIWDPQIGAREIGPYSGFGSKWPNSINNYGKVVGSVEIIHKSNFLASIENNVSNSAARDMHNLFHITETKGIYAFDHIVEMLRNTTFDAEVHSFKKKGANSFSMNHMYNKDLLFLWDKEEQLHMIETALSTTVQREAFMWDMENGIEGLGTLGGEWSTAFDINDHGQVVGYSDIGNGEHRAFYWDEEHGMIELPTIGGNSIARAINNHGQIVGESYDSNGQFYPVMWEVTFEAGGLAEGAW